MVGSGDLFSILIVLLLFDSLYVAVTCIVCVGLQCYGCFVVVLLVLGLGGLFVIAVIGWWFVCFAGSLLLVDACGFCMLLICLVAVLGGCLCVGLVGLLMWVIDLILSVWFLYGCCLLGFCCSCGVGWCLFAVACGCMGCVVVCDCRVVYVDCLGW